MWLGSGRIRSARPSHVYIGRTHARYRSSPTATIGEPWWSPDVNSSFHYVKYS